MPLEDVSTTAVEHYLQEVHEAEGRLIDKILVRQVNPLMFSCQIWFVDEKEPEAFYLKLEEE